MLSRLRQPSVVRAAWRSTLNAARVIDIEQHVVLPAQPPPRAALHPIHGPAAWTSAELVRSGWWGAELSRVELDQLDAALVHLLKSGDVEWTEDDVPLNITRANFPIGSELVSRLSAMSDALEERGATMIANMPVDKYDVPELAAAYLGLCAHLGQWVPQSSAGLRSKSRGYGLPLGKIRAEMSGNTPIEGKQSNNYFRLHTDRCDVLSLLSIRTARAGGRSRIASAVKIHDLMVERHPELAALLYAPIPRIWEAGVSELPVWAVHKGKFTSQISPSYIENAQFVPGVRKLSVEEIEAIDLLEEIGLEVGHDFLQEPGQMTFLNNHLVYHGRTAWSFEGDAQKDAHSGRLLLRTWLSPFNSRELPDTPEFRLLWGDTSAGAPRGGLEPAVRAGIVEKPKELTDAINSGTYDYYGLFPRKFAGQSVTGVN